MKQKDQIAKKNKNDELWLFFDEINTCWSLSLITEIFINSSYEGKKISDNIRLIGTCNSYRKRKGNKEKCGLSLSKDNDDELVYLIQPLPQSVLYYVFSFGSIDEIDEKKNIKSIIENLFTKDEKDLHECSTDAISQCHKYLRKEFDDSVVSLREISRFTKCVKFFQEYFEKKNKYLGRLNIEKNNKIRSIICSIYICYYIRLIDDNNRNQRSIFENQIRALLLKLVNSKDEISKLDELNKIMKREEEDKEQNKKFYENIEKILITDEEKKKMISMRLAIEEEEIATQELNDLKNKIKEDKLRYFKELKLK